ncbi:TetR/AcrR family transcriptional regulator [Turneriella parva]|uniref:Transcriptional regulator, TetR family n=1 Tax=Turneriella parva (strain ATCC BAA-1111 / DSM 21527 / NCTC 11395 / H) TaxID=869212 RepID=I4B287_TURPD|nr:TetR/AcrR family transcriptional regulator [Turneriella parva]AFM11394.1 transcriptional regulator, TetR family [Turneriella parva DSM 21527]
MAKSAAKQPIGKRDQTKLVNRQQILEAAKNLFADKGFEATNVRDIIHESSLSPGTFYNYFQSKEEIFEVLTDEIISEVREQIQVSYKNVKMDRAEIMKSLEKFFQIFLGNPRLMKFLSRNQSYLRELRSKGRFDGMLQDLEKALDDGVKNGMLPALPVKIVAIAVFGAVFEIIATMVITPGFDVKKAIETLSQLLFVHTGK